MASIAYKIRYYGKIRMLVHKHRSGTEIIAPTLIQLIGAVRLFNNLDKEVK